MSNKVTDFPQYRKLSNAKVFYKIVNDRLFEEIQIIGSSARLHSIEAKQYPEILRIQDLLKLTLSGFELATEKEYNDLLNHYSL